MSLPDVVAEICREELGPALIGVYLHGSAAMGQFVEGRSDVDILVVVERALTKEDKRRLAERLTRPALELTVMTHRAVTSLDETFELHVAGERVVDGEGHPGDSDLVMHVAACRAAGRALVGPDPKDVFPAVPRDELLEAFAGELDWAVGHAPSAYQVLNACRALRFAEEDVWCSKLDGGEWALDRVGQPALVQAALRHQRGEDVDVDEAGAAALAYDVSARLRRRIT